MPTFHNVMGGCLIAEDREKSMESIRDLCDLRWFGRRRFVWLASPRGRSVDLRDHHGDSDAREQSKS